MSERVEAIEGWLCPLEMPFELHLGAITYRTRDYVALRLTTTSGYVGAAVGYSRGTPLLSAAEVLAAQVLNMAAIDPVEVSHTLRRQYSPGWGALVRAASLIDVSLWDIAAQRAAVPLGVLLGGSGLVDVPLMAVAGYFLDERGHGPVLDEIAEFVDLGYRSIKLIVPGHDLESDLAFVADVSALLPEGADLGIDFHGAFTSVSDAVRYGSAFSGLGLRFIEDPFPSYEIAAVSEVAKQLSIPLAAGEDVITATSYDLLVAGGVRFLRADVTASGGYTDVIPAISRAGTAGAEGVPHVWPHLHQPLAIASPSVRTIEVIPHTTGADPIDAILQAPFPIIDGKWSSPHQPGLYLPLDWDSIVARATSKFSIRRR